MNPSLVSFIPCSPTRFRVPVWLLPLRGPLSVAGRSGNSEPRLDLGGPQMLGLVSLTTGELGMTGLLCALMLGDTARRLKRFGSKSSSRRRFLLNSPTNPAGAPWDASLREPGRSLGLANSVVDPTVVDGVISIARSSSETDEAPCRRWGGGGVR